MKIKGIKNHEGYKNEEVKIYGMNWNLDLMKVRPTLLSCVISNDERGKTLSISDGSKMFTIPFEPLERYLK